MKSLVLFVLSILSLIVMDAIWLGYIGKAFYIEKIGSLMRDEGVNLLSALLVYLMLGLGIVVFVLPKANYMIVPALAYGALYGFLTYAIYDFTNLAVLKGWRWDISLIDILWGTFLCGVTSALVVWAYNSFLKA